jgi:hypothetical protein
MKLLTLLSRVLVLLGLLTAATAIGAGPAYAEGSAVTHAFAADSGDACRLGATRGTLTWISRGPLAVTTVDVAGALVDRPLPNDPTTCRDPRYSSVTFTAFRGAVVVDSEARRVDNGQLSFRFQLTGSTTVYTPIDRVVVEVCRHAPPGMGLPDYCGRAVEYLAP